MNPNIMNDEQWIDHKNQDDNHDNITGRGQHREDPDSTSDARRIDHDHNDDNHGQYSR